MILYRILILPIEYLIEVIYVMMYRLFDSPGIALFGVSLCVSFLVLPLYLRSDEIQEKEQQKQKEMQLWIQRIKRAFTKDEQYMRLTAYYRMADYHPIYAIRSVLSLLLQIPFFVAAYHFLSNLKLLQGCGMGPIRDLGMPDGLITVGVVSVNILPILMTTINCISGAIYTKGYPIRAKLQVYILAVVFLVLLYKSPAGLVIYWTMNNLFSLCKNIVMKYVKDKRRFLEILAAAVSVAFVVYVVLAGKISQLRQENDNEGILMYAFVAVLLFLPLLSRKVRFAAQRMRADEVAENVGKIALLEELFLLVLMGWAIPISVISSSPLDFVNIFYYKNPIYFVMTTFCLYAGVFLFWGNVIFRVSDSKGRKVYAGILFILILTILPTYFFFKPKNVQSISILLQWLPSWPRFERTERMINLLILAVAGAIAIWLWRKSKKHCGYIVAILLIAVTGLSVVQLGHTIKVLGGLEIDHRLQEEDRSIELSKKGNNVILIMLDRAIGAYIPYIFDQYPEIEQQFNGFTFYPNTASFGLVTRYGAPTLFGGYDYTPEMMNLRSDEKLVVKHDEALSVLPVSFGEQGYEVTVCDVPFAGYKNVPDYSIYDEYPYVNAFHLEGSIYAGYSWEDTWQLMERNFAFYSLYKVVPAMLQDEIYDDGDYLKADKMTGNLTRTGFADGRASMDYFTTNTEIAEDDTDHFIMYCNNMTHDPVELQLPDYEQVRDVDNTGFDVGIPRTLNGRTITAGNDEDGIMHYQANVVAMMMLGDWLDYLREQGVYDNTRIIIVADHGWRIAQFDDMILSNGVDVEGFNPLLMEKDFNAEGFRTDDSFMTNADAPAMAVEGLITDPVNPFTGNPIDMSAKQDGINVVYSANFGLTDATQFETKDEPWYNVHDNIFDEKNWSEIEGR